MSDEIPLMQFGSINTGRYRPDARPATGQIFSWVLNNYWTTNFRSSQEGEMTWRYALTSGSDAGNAFATMFGWGIRVGFVSRVLPGSAGSTTGAGNRSVWPFEPSTVLLISAKPAQPGIILHLREAGGTATTLSLTEPGAGWRIEEVDALGASLRASVNLSFQPFESKFVRLSR